jgi:hypothetical protein
MGVSGEFVAEWGGSTSEFWINKDSGGGFSFGLENLDITYGSGPLPMIDISIQGSIDFAVEGSLYMKPGFVEIDATGTIDWGTSCTFTFNGNFIKIGGTYTLTGGSGTITISGDTTDLSIDVTGGPSLTVNNLYIETTKWYLTSNPVTVESNAGVVIHLEKDNSQFDMSGDVNYEFNSISVKYENQEFLTADKIGFGGGGFFEVDAKIDTTVKLQINVSLLDINNFNFEPPDSWGWRIDHFELGSLSLDVDASAYLYVSRYTTSNFVISGGGTLSGSLTDLDVLIPHGGSYRKVYVKFNSLTFDGTVLARLGRFGASQEPMIELQCAGSTSLSGFQFDFGETSDPTEWHASIGSASGALDLNIELYAHIKHYAFEGSASFNANSVYLEYDSSGYEWDSIINIDSFDFNGAGYAKLNLKYQPNFRIDGNVYADLDNFYVATGVGSSEEKKVTIPDLYLNGNGELYGTWDEGYLQLDGDVDVQYNVDMETLNYGTWHADGHIIGDAMMEAYWAAGETGHIDLTIREDSSINLLTIEHDNLVLDFLSMDIDNTVYPVTSTVEWDRGDVGYFDIDNEIDGQLKLFELDYNNEEWALSFGITVGTINIDPGDLLITWDKNDPNEGEVVGRNGILSIEGLEFYLTLDETDVTVKFADFVKDYNKPVTLKWYKDTGGNIVGGYIDSSNTELATWIEFEAVNNANGKGVRATLYGLKADQFWFKKQTDGEWDFDGEIQIANRLTVALLWNNVWHELDLQWEFNTDPEDSWMKYTCTCPDNEDIIFHLLSLNVGQWNFDVDLELYANRYLLIEYNFAVNDNYGHIRMDTGNQYIGALLWEISKDSDPDFGIEIIVEGLKAGEYNGELPLLYWYRDGIIWGIGWNAAWDQMDMVNLEIWAKLDGTWTKIWPP